jgi:hypothetical protein
MDFGAELISVMWYMMLIAIYTLLLENISLDYSAISKREKG